MKTRSIAALIAVTVALGAVAFAKESPPPLGPPVEFRLPKARRLTLDNGMRVTLVEYGAVPKLDVRLVVRTGNVDESADETWLADLMVDLMEQGTTRRTADEVARAAAAMGGSISIWVGPDVTRFDGESLFEFGPDLVALIAELVRQPRWPQDQLDRLKDDMVRNIALARARPQALASERFAQLVYGEHAYGRRYPAPELVQGFTLDQIKTFYDEHVGAARAHLYVAGKFDAEAVEAAIRAAFGDWQPGTAFDAPPPTLKAAARRHVHVIDRPGAVQSTLRVGLPVVDPSHPDYVALQVTNTLLGGYFSSRITANIREDKGYTYSPYSALGTDYRAAVWTMNADVTTEHTGASLAEIFAEIERLRKEPPPADELRAVQSYLAGGFILRNSSRGALLDELQFVDLHGLGEDHLATFVDRVLAVTPDQVSEMARKYLDGSQMTLVIAGDDKVIRTQLAPYGKLAK